MDKQALSKFAPDERRRLIEAVQKRLAILGITERSKFKTIEEWLVEQDGIITVNNIQYTDYKRSSFEQLFKEFQQVGYETLVEETAYTWFNRLIAIRYMEVKDVLPDYVKILGNNGQSNLPEILNDYSYLSVDKAEIESLKMNNQEEVSYRKLFLAAANKLGDVLPFLFKKLGDWTELVLPERMLEPGGIIERIVTNEELTNSFQDGIEVIGWLYQYYISEVKDKVMKLKKVTKEQLPARTQLFTPKWIVQYMVESSLGQLWLESNPSSELKNKWKYYVEPAEQTEEVQKVINKIKYANINLEAITFMDPAVGSGHILSYAYDLFYDMYLEDGYSKREIPQLILHKNLYGIDIDDRAAQLAAFSLTMKAVDSMGRSYWRNVVMPNIISIQQSNTIDIAYVEQLFKGKQLELAKTLLDTFKDAKEYGSLLKPTDLDTTDLKAEFSYKAVPNNEQFSLFDASHGTIIDPEGQTELLKHLINQQQLLTSKYDVVVTNPPYMGNSTMSKFLSEFAKKIYPESKADLFAMFMERNRTFIKENGFNATINQHSWMFLSSYENLRKKIIDESVIYSMLHLGPRAFEDIGGEVVQSTTYVQREFKINGFIGIFYRLVNSPNALQKEIDMLKGKNIYFTNSSNFSAIPGSPIAYRASESIREVFKNHPLLIDIAAPRVGLQTSDSNRFLRLWFEIDQNKFGLRYRNQDEAKNSNKKWFPFNKGGEFRKWYGNNIYTVNWENDGHEVREYNEYLNSTRESNIGIGNTNFYFKPGITWGAIASNKLSLRYFEDGFIFSNAGMAIFGDKELLLYIIAILNSKASAYILQLISETLNFNQGDLKRVPIVLNDEIKNKINLIADENIKVEKEDWDSFETSWDFKKHPFIEFKQDTTELANSYVNWEVETEGRFINLKENEEELNRIFINLYGLQDYLTPEVEDKDVTIRLADREKDTKSFLSYFVGCLLGRYSIDFEGLAFTGGKFEWDKYKTFIPSNDGIVTFTDEKVLPDEQDIYERLKEFLVAIFSEKSLVENLGWVAEGLGKKDSETVEATIRNYFVKDFIKGHIQTYQKRPIYWLIDSGNQKGMQSLVYLHRYTPQTIGLAMQNHFIPLLTQWRNLVHVTEAELESGSLSTTEKREKTKLLNTYKKRSEELADFQESLNELGRQEISLNLDDGVKVNYQKLASVLYPIKF